MSMGGEIMEEHYENEVIPKLKKEYETKGMQLFFESLKNDPELYRAYKDNIAMAFKDEYLRSIKALEMLDIHKVANQAADNFLQLLIK